MPRRHRHDHRCCGDDNARRRAPAAARAGPRSIPAGAVAPRVGDREQLRLVDEGSTSSGSANDVLNSASWRDPFFLESARRLRRARPSLVRQASSLTPRPAAISAKRLASITFRTTTCRCPRGGTRSVRERASDVDAVALRVPGREATSSSTNARLGRVPPAMLVDQPTPRDRVEPRPAQAESWRSSRSSVVVTCAKTVCVTSSATSRLRDDIVRSDKPRVMATRRRLVVSHNLYLAHQPET